jgi:hypothetical protein
MKLSATSALVLIAVAAESCMAIGQTCLVGTLGGECLNTSTCSSVGGESTSGHCPGAANSQCSFHPLYFYARA